MEADHQNHPHDQNPNVVEVAEGIEPRAGHTLMAAPRFSKLMKPKTSAGLRKWRADQPRGAIMKPATFEKIKTRAAASGATNPDAVAGAAYWRTAKAKYAKR